MNFPRDALYPCLLLAAIAGLGVATYLAWKQGSTATLMLLLAADYLVAALALSWASKL